MISILLVAPESDELSGITARHPEVEVLRAYGLEETLEKLGRNRRIDAVLLLAGEEARRIAEAIREDNPAPPPIYVPANKGAPAGTRTLTPQEPEGLLDQLVREIEG